MKELSLLEKADAYDRVAKEVKDFFDGKQKMPFDVDKTLEYLFPELKDEKKIKREIIEYVKTENPSRNDWITWLEKQGEISPIISDSSNIGKNVWNKEDEKRKKQIIGILEGWLSTFKETYYAEDCKDGIVWLKSLQDRFSPMNRNLKSDNVAKPNFKA